MSKADNLCTLPGMLPANLHFTEKQLDHLIRLLPPELQTDGWRQKLQRAVGMYWLLKWRQVHGPGGGEKNARVQSRKDHRAWLARTANCATELLNELDDIALFEESRKMKSLMDRTSLGFCKHASFGWR